MLDGLQPVLQCKCNINVGSHFLVIQRIFVHVKLMCLHVNCKLLQGAFAVYTYMYFGSKSPVCSLILEVCTWQPRTTDNWLCIRAHSQSNCLLLFSVSRCYTEWAKGPVSFFPQYLKLMYIWSAVVPALLSCSSDNACVTAWVNSGSSLRWRWSLPHIVTFADKSVPWMNLVCVCTSIRVGISKG